MLRGSAAAAALRHRLGPPPVDAAAYGDEQIDDRDLGLTPLPAWVVTRVVQRWLWGTPDSTGTPGSVSSGGSPTTSDEDASWSVPTLRDPGAYRPGDPSELGWSPHQALGDDSELSAESREGYRRASADITMRGGTTSGVIYPLVVCEIARRFRLRNIGGASAGAIAAAAAAAAETGRIRTGGGSAGPAPGESDGGTELRRRQGHVRPGFAGLADTMAWLAQCDDREYLDGRGRTVHVPDLYRVARLFQPSPAGRPLLRVAAAVMRGKTWRVPFLLLGTLGWWRALLAVLIGASAVLALLFWDPAAPTTSAGLSHPIGVLAALAGVVGPVVVAMGVSLAVLTWPVREPPLPEMDEPIADPPPDPRRPINSRRVRIALLLLQTLVLLVLGGLGLVVACRVGSLVTVFVATSVVVVGALVASRVARLVGHAKQDLHFGLVPGSASGDPGASVPWGGRRAATAVDVSVRPLIIWLSHTLSELAGMPLDEPVQGRPQVPQVLCFRHLWNAGLEPPDTGVLEAQLEDLLKRRVNLQLVASELTQGRCYTFPLPTAEQTEHREHTALYFREDDLAGPGREVFPPEVMRCLIPDAEQFETARDARTGDPVQLYRLPEPWDLPVIVAVRLSLSLPLLFEAVRFYRLLGPTTVRDDFGRPLYDHLGGDAIRYPGAMGQWATELWFSDGGITSNFPIHLFDSPLPKWPTFGINLGEYPPGFSEQDVWLPEDWEALVPPSSVMRSSITAFVGQIVTTARSWRDIAQTSMPAQRGRVAWVRQRPWEGGNNLYMHRDTIAGLALRGVFAGARLRRRFGTEAQWRRHQWLRLRGALQEFTQFSRGLRMSKNDPFYTDLAPSPPVDAREPWRAAITELQDSLPADPEQPWADQWHKPPPGFSRAAADIVDRYSGAAPNGAGTDPLGGNVPKPGPHLEQAPSS